MNGATEREMVAFKQIKAAERAAVTHADARAVKAMTVAWIRAAKTPTAKHRRRRMAQAIRFANSEFPQEQTK